MLSFAALGGNSKGQGTGVYESGAPLRKPVRAFPTLKPEDVISFGLGYYNTLVHKRDLTVEGVGANDMGQLAHVSADGKSHDSSRLVKAHIDHVKQFAYEGGHALALLDDGRMKAWGGGQGPFATPVPVDVPAPKGLEVHAGAGAAFEWTVDGWYGQGENKSGQLGVPPKLHIDLPVKLPFPTTGVKKIVIGGLPSEGGHTLVLFDDGTVGALGANGSGQCGLGEATAKPIPALKKIPGLTGVVDIDASASHSLALLADGTVKAWGSGKIGQLGLGDLLDRHSPTTVPLYGKASIVTAIFRASIFVVNGDPFSCGWSVGEGAHGVTGQPDNVSTPTLIKGFEGRTVKKIWRGEYHEIFLVEGDPLPLTLSAVRGPGSIMVQWVSDTNLPIQLKLRKRGEKAWGATVGGKAGVKPSPPSYTFEKLTPGVEYEVIARNKDLGGLTVTETPL